MIRLQNPANEESSFIITLTWYTETGEATTPSSAIWTLSDVYGNIKNSRESIGITPLSTSNVIVLKGDDLKVNDARTELIVTVKAVYDSTNDTDLNLNEEIRFWVENLETI